MKISEGISCSGIPAWNESLSELSLNIYVSDVSMKFDRKTESMEKYCTDKHIYTHRRSDFFTIQNKNIYTSKNDCFTINDLH